MNPTEITTGLRNLPLSQYLLRGRRSNAAAQYESLRRLQEEQCAVVPLTCGPFRVFVADRLEEKLRSVGTDRTEFVRSLCSGLEVVEVEPSEGKTIGRIVGLAQQGRWRVVLAFEPELPALADWRLLSIERSRTSALALAQLNATWYPSSCDGADVAAGDAMMVVQQCRVVKEEHKSWVDSWRPPALSIPFMMVHLPHRLPSDSNFVEVLRDLVSLRSEVFAPFQTPLRSENPRSRDTLRIVVPDRRVQLELHLRQLADSGANEWVLVGVSDCPPDVPCVARLDTKWRKFSLSARNDCRSIPWDQEWLERLNECEISYPKRWESGWLARNLSGGFFGIRPSDNSLNGLRRVGVPLAQLCEGMNRGLHLFEVTGPDSEAIVAAPEGANFCVKLAPFRPSIGVSDWKLIDVRSVDSVKQRPFARIVAEWSEAIRGQPTLSGDAARLLKELTILQDIRQGPAKEIEVLQEQDGHSPDLVERMTTWRKVWELERDSFQVGLKRLERDSSGYLVVPAKKEEVEDWIEKVQSLNPEGVDWNRYPLDLRMGDERASLVIQSVGTTQRKGGELVLSVACDNTRGRALLDRFCDGADATRDTSLQLFLPDTQLGLIDNALAFLDPNRKSGTHRRGGVGENLAPDDLSLRTLQSILSEPNNLQPVTWDWPPLPNAPLVQLSPSQEKAVRAAIFGPDMTLIQGPPGTGKTTVILEILRQLFRAHGRTAGFKVLLVAPTHVAVDNVLERLVVPRRGVNLLMELGVAPYRVGPTRSIAEHLRGFTPDCINTEYRQRMEQQVAHAIAIAHGQSKLDRAMMKVLAEGAEHDNAAWRNALSSGELPDKDCNVAWPEGLEESWLEEVKTPEGRMRAWRHWLGRGSRPEEWASLLQRWLDFLKANQKSFSELLLANANLICATTIGCATHSELKSVIYDYVIVDEAGKEQASRLLVPLIRGERWVLVGDHHQLSPYADDELKCRLTREGLDQGIITRSLFEELQEPFERRGCYVFLDRQGRMHPDISTFVSQSFYRGRLHDFPNTVAHSIPQPSFLPDSPKLLVLDTGWLADPSERPNNHGKGFYNPTECAIAIRLLQSFVKAPGWQRRFGDGDETNPLSIGIIAPYRRQVEELTAAASRDALLNRLVNQGCLHIGTVDSFQGQEKDLIVFSSTRSNGTGNFGFADDKQRLNVAFSRARARLVVLIDGSTVKRAQSRSGLIGSEAEICNHLAALLEHAGSHGGLLEVPANWREQWRG